MIQINHMTALLAKYLKDTAKNFEVLVLFIVYPVICFVMSQSMGAEMTFFVPVFATMHFVFTPIVVTSNAIAEEKSKNTLRVLRMSGISSLSFFLSNAIFVTLLTCITGSTFIFMSHDSNMNVGLFYSAAIIGIIISMLIGISVGSFSKSTGAANGLAVPLGLILSLLPMLSYFNEGIKSVSRFLFGQQVFYFISGQSWNKETIIVCLINLFIVSGLYIFLYSRTKLDE